MKLNYFLLHCAYRYKVKLTAFTENRPLSPKRVAMKRNNSSIFSAPLGFVAFSTCDSLSDIETDISPELGCQGKEVGQQGWELQVQSLTYYLEP